MGGSRDIAEGLPQLGERLVIGIAVSGETLSLPMRFRKPAEVMAGQSEPRLGLSIDSTGLASQTDCLDEAIGGGRPVATLTMPRAPQAQNLLNNFPVVGPPRNI